MAAEELEMQLFTYTAPTLAEAMEIAKQKHGENALMVSNREIKKKSLLENGLYEVVIVDRKPKEATPTITQIPSDDGLPDNDIAKRLDKIAQKELAKRREEKRMRENEIKLEIENAAKEISKIVETSTKTSQNRFELATSNETESDSKKSRNSNKNDSKDSKESKLSPYNPIAQTRALLAKANAEGNKELKKIEDSLDKLNDKFKLLQNMVWNDMGIRVQNTTNIPHEFAEIYRICKNSGMKNEHLDELMQLSQKLVPMNMRENTIMTKRFFREVLRKMIPCRAEHIDMKRKRIIMLVGPTGVGKTTTIAKLATHYKTHKYKVGLITLDAYRIGAFEQLSAYAKRLKITINRVESTAEFERELDNMKYCDYILIDTIGSSQNDKERLDFLRKFVSNDYNIDVNLVLSATTKFEDLRDIYGAFGILNIDTLIFSKLDESKGFGNIFSLIYDTKKPVSYLTIGQEVPEDILAAKNDYIADYIINGFSKPKRKSIIR